MTDSDDPERRTTKVERVIDEYDLHRIGQELEMYWTGDGSERKSLRDLADYFNRHVLESALRSANMNPLDQEGQKYYELLTGESNTGAVVEVEARLERNGVDVDAVTDSFVTYQAIRNYLRDVREATYEETSDEEQIEKERVAIERLLTRLEKVAEEKLTRLVNTDRITLGSFRIFVSVVVLCEDCDNQYGIVEILRQGNCDCE